MSLLMIVQIVGRSPGQSSFSSYIASEMERRISCSDLVLVRICTYTSRASDWLTQTGRGQSRTGMMRSLSSAKTKYESTSEDSCSKIPSLGKTIQVCCLLWTLLPIGLGQYREGMRKVNFMNTFIRTLLQIGCGATSYREGKWFSTLYTCNYGPNGNFINGEMYKQGSGCSQCPSNTKCSNEYPGLCTKGNQYSC